MRRNDAEEALPTHHFVSYRNQPATFVTEHSVDGARSMVYVHVPARFEVIAAQVPRHLQTP